jgi:hypothetical protein
MNENFTKKFSVRAKKLGNIALKIMPNITGTVVIKNI